MSHRIVIFLVFLGALAGASGRTPITLPKDLESTLRLLDSCVEHREDFYDQKAAMITRERQRLIHGAIPDSLPSIYWRLGKAYRYSHVDSALTYFDRGAKAAQSAGNDSMHLLLRASWASLLTVDGAIAEAVAAYEALDPSKMPRTLIGDFYSQGHRMYAYAEEFYRIDSVKAHFHNQMLEMARHMVELHSAEAPDRDYYMAILATQEGKPEEALRLLDNLTHSYPPGSSFYSRIAEEMVKARYMLTGHVTDEMLRLYAVGAISDIVNGHRESMSLERVGTILHSRGDIDRAYRFLQASMTDAVASGSRMRALQSAQVLPVITEAYEQRDRVTTSHLHLFIILALIAFIAVAVLAVYLYRDSRKEREMQRRLSASVASRDNYISNVMQITSLSIQRLEEFNRLAGRKIKANQTHELLGMIESGKMLQEQTRRLHQLFDQAFLSTFPTFQQDVNALLQQQWQIPTPDTTDMGLMTPEMRLLAFMRLGINDGARLARFLGLSINTVYAYRNRLRSHAIDRDTFEAAVMGIGNI